ncbi:MAG: hypothetical protein ACFE96_04555, partial [Candidatus Hermodarchaeota archaeon]
MDPNVFLVLFTILLWIIIADNLLLGIFLIIRAYQVKFSNLFWMGIAFILFFIGLVSNFLLGYGYFIEEIFVNIGYYLIAFFTYLTFYKRKSDNRAKMLLYVLLILLLARIALGLIIEINLNPITRYFERIVINCYVFLVFYWLGWSSFSTFKRFREREIAPWIKSRYKTISIVSFLWPIHALVAIFVPWDTEFGDPSNLLSFINFGITVILSLIFILGMIKAWVIPKRLKNYLNRKKGYKSSEEEDFSEVELMKLIKNQLG